MGTVLLPAFAFVVALHATLQLLCLGLSAARVPIGRPVASALVLVALLVGALFATWTRRATAASAALPRPGTELRTRAHVGGRALQVLALLQCGWAAVVYARLWRVAWTRPAYDWDGLYYHIPAMHGWVHAARVSWIPGMADLPFANGYPMAVETLGFLVQRLTGSSRLVDGGNLWYWPLGALALATMARLLGCSPLLSGLAAAGLVAAPAFVILSTTSYVDPAFASAVMALVAVSLLVLREADGGVRPLRDPPPSRRAALRKAPSTHSAVLWGLTAGLVLGTKGFGVLAVAVIFGSTTLLLLAWTRGRRRDALRAPAIAGVVALSIGGYWYARNLVNTGNPIFPIQLKLLGVTLREGYDPHIMTQGDLPPALARWPRLLQVPVSWLELDAPIREYGQSGGLGVLWIAGGLPALAWLAVRGRLRAEAVGAPAGRTPVGLASHGPEAHRALLRLLALTGFLLFVQPAAWWSRFTLWLNGAGLPAMAALLQRHVAPVQRGAARGARAGRAALLGLALVVLTLAAIETQTALRAQERVGRVIGPAGQTGPFVSSADRYFLGIEQAPGFRQLFAARAIARSPWSRLGVLLGGVLSLPLHARAIHPLALPLDAAQLDRVQQAGVEWVVWDVLAAGPPPPALAERAAETFAFHPGSDAHFLAVRMRPLAPGPGAAAAAAPGAQKNAPAP